MESIPVNNWSRKTVQLYSKSIMQKGMSADLARCVCSCLQLRNTSFQLSNDLLRLVYIVADERKTRKNLLREGLVAAVIHVWRKSDRKDTFEIVIEILIKICDKSPSFRDDVRTQGFRRMVALYRYISNTIISPKPIKKSLLRLFVLVSELFVATCGNGKGAQLFKTEMHRYTNNILSTPGQLSTFGSEFFNAFLQMITLLVSDGDGIDKKMIENYKGSYIEEMSDILTGSEDRKLVHFGIRIIRKIGNKHDLCSALLVGGCFRLLELNNDRPNVEQIRTAVITLDKAAGKCQTATFAIREDSAQNQLIKMSEIVSLPESVKETISNLLNMSIRLGQSACSDNEEDDRVRSVNSVLQSDASFEGKRNGSECSQSTIVPPSPKETRPKRRRVFRSEERLDLEHVDLDDLVEAITEEELSSTANSFRMPRRRAIPELSDGAESVISRISCSSQMSSASSRRVRIPWTPSEEKNVKNGVAKFGKNWKKILAEFTFNPRRTTVDLKDKFRSLENRPHNK